MPLMGWDAHMEMSDREKSGWARLVSTLIWTVLYHSVSLQAWYAVLAVFALQELAQLRVAVSRDRK